MMLHYFCTFVRFLIGSVRRLAVVAIAVLLGLSIHAHAATYFVKQGGTGTGTTSFANASGDLQAMINVANGTPIVEDEIWVAAGTYVPTVKFPSGTDDSTKTFLISKNDLKIYGGFAGTETLLSDRDPALNITILSGEIGNTSDLTDNCYHVVRFDPGPSFCDQSQPPCSGHCACQGGCTVYPSEITDSVQLDGFTVTKGYADGVTLFDQNRGGGMYLLFASPAIQNCTIVANFASERGGGVHVLWPASFDPCAPTYPVPTPHFVSTSFLGNTCEGDGFNHNNAQPVFINCAFSGNHAYASGGGIYSDGGELDVQGCTFSLNEADGTGGAIYNGFNEIAGGDLTLVNSILWGNIAENNPELYDDPQTENHSVTYTDIQGGFTGTGNIDADPLFINPDGRDNTPGTTDDNLRLGCESEARNAGSNSAVPDDDYDVDDDDNETEETPDRDRSTRILDTTVDMGLYENTPEDSVCAGDATDDCIVNVDDLLTVINNWDCTGSCTGDVAPATGCDIGNDVVNVDDLLAVINGWGACPCDNSQFSESQMPQSVDDCMDACSLDYTPYSNEWDFCVAKCVEGLCEAQIIDCE